jgi:hypothetical protein
MLVAQIWRMLVSDSLSVATPPMDSKMNTPALSTIALAAFALLICVFFGSLYLYEWRIKRKQRRASKRGHRDKQA